MVSSPLARSSVLHLQLRFHQDSFGASWVPSKKKIFSWSELPKEMSLVGASGMDVAPGGKVYGCLQKASRAISILQTEKKSKALPVIHSLIRSEEVSKALYPVDLGKLDFVSESPRLLRPEGTTCTYTPMTVMCHTAPHVLRANLSHLAQAVVKALQSRDCHRGKKQMPRDTPLVLYINGNGGVLERMQETGVDVIGFDWTVGIADGSVGIQGNVDPGYLFSPLPALTDEIHRVLRCARTKPKVHIHNLPLVPLKKLCPISLK